MSVAIVAGAASLGLGGTAWFHARYHDAPSQTVLLLHFSNAEHPEDPEARSIQFGKYPHGVLRVQHLGETRFRFLIEPASEHTTTIELPDVDLALLVASVPPWLKIDSDLTKVGLIDREWNRQQVSFQPSSRYVRIHEGGNGFEQRAVSRVDLARNCLNAGLWEVLLYTLGGRSGYTSRPGSSFRWGCTKLCSSG